MNPADIAKRKELKAYHGESGALISRSVNRELCARTIVKEGTPGISLLMIKPAHAPTVGERMVLQEFLMTNSDFASAWLSGMEGIPF
jgi:hypothetical protein